MEQSPYSWIEKDLKTIHKAGWYRTLQPIQVYGATLQIEGKNLINFASNDYLGLTGHPRLIEAAINATKKYGTGTTGSRLITGHRDIHRQLENAIARLKNTADAIVFSSGYMANLGTISALVGKRDIIISDEYNHSSLKAGATLSQATTFNYLHNNLQNLEKILSEHRPNYRKCLIITDAVFSMDGDICQLPNLLKIAQKYQAMLLIDEAHSTGIFGANGGGIVEHFGLTGTPLIQMGTLSKAFASLGGYVAGSAPLIDYLRNRAPTWIYTTGLSPADTAAALEAIHLSQQQPQRRKQLWQNIKQCQQIFNKNQIPTLHQQSPIICVPVKNPQTAIEIGKQLKQAQILAGIIRPPTVPSSRIRITLISTHSPEFIQHLGNICQQIFTQLKN